MVEISFPRPAPELGVGAVREREGRRRETTVMFIQAFPLISRDCPYLCLAALHLFSSYKYVVFSHFQLTELSLRESFTSIYTINEVHHVENFF